MSLKDITTPFSPDSEEEVRVSLAFYFKDIGFNLSELSFEDSFQIQLGHTAIVVEKNLKKRTISGRSDILLTRNNEPLAIVETKAPKEKITDQDRDQSLSYARLLLHMPPYTIVTNGDDIRVYDTITGNLITSGNPADSEWWKNGGNYEGLSGADKSWACKKLISVSIETLREYAAKQITEGLSDFRSTPDTLRRYSPNLYIQRDALKGVWESFLNSDKLCFGITGESGVGKTNEICYLAESIALNDRLIGFFYAGGGLWDGLTSRIRSDFIWEFGRDQNISHIINRLNDLAKIHKVKIVIFIDGLDEIPSTIDIIKGELLEFTKHLDPKYLRICFSCKSYDLNSYVHDRDGNLNKLGKSLYPPPMSEDELPGINLDFLNVLIVKYKLSPPGPEINSENGPTVNKLR